MDSGVLFNIFVFLAAACVVVPLASRFRLGSVLGYLVAGVMIGPFGAGLIGNPEEILHIAEFGVVMMLFIIGLELEPATLWKLRKAIVGLGGLQVVLTCAAFTALGLALGFTWQVSLAVGMALALSSTALVLQMLQEKGLMNTSAGESAFAVLLFQDIAVIPILVIMPLLATHGAVIPGHEASWFEQLPGWAHTLVIAGVIAAIVVAGRYLSHYLFLFIARTNLRELFTATSLALVVGITLLMQAVGVSPALGAFVAGVVLANSQYKHTLETDIEPFKGLLLGLFFISVGMGMNFDLLAEYPLRIFGGVVALIAVKMVILSALARGFGITGAQNTLFTAALAQGGEFAFVLFQFASGLNVLDGEQSGMLILTVALSMAATPFLMILNDKFVVPRFMSVLPERDYDRIDEHSNPVILAGYGRYGQIIGRFLTGQGVKVTILESDPDQIELLRSFDNKVYFGDASRLDLLKSAGADRAKILIVAVDNPDKCLEIVRMAKEEFPNLLVYARARNRRHAYELYKAGVDYFRREMFDSSLMMAQDVMKKLGFRAYAMRQKAIQFTKLDEEMLHKSFEFYEQEPELISFAKQAMEELENILKADQLVFIALAGDVAEGDDAAQALIIFVIEDDQAIDLLFTHTLGCVRDVVLLEAIEDAIGEDFTGSHLGQIFTAGDAAHDDVAVGDDTVQTVIIANGEEAAIQLVHRFRRIAYRRFFRDDFRVLFHEFAHFHKASLGLG